MNCLHCGSKAGRARDNELTETECLNIAHQLIEMGNENITLIGGEVLLVPHWYKVARTFVDANVNVNIITNGCSIEEPQIEAIKQSGIKDICISIDGLEENHDLIRNKNGSFRSAIQAINKLKAEGFCIGVATTILDINFYDLEKMYLLFKELGITVWQLQIAAPMGRCAEKRNSLLNPNKISDIMKFIYEKRQVRKKPIVIAGDNVGYFCKYDVNVRSIDFDKTSYFMGCMAGLFNIGIDSIGNVKGCESLYSDKFIEGNLRKESLEEIWEKEGAFAYNRDFTFDMLHGKCKNCDKGYICAGGCRQLSYFSNKNNCFYDNIYCNYKH